MSYMTNRAFLLRLTFVPVICIFPHMKDRKVILFNKRWQAYEDTQVMVSNRDGKDCQIFCRASDVKIRDNVWEHNIVSTIEVLQEEADGIKFHYGPIHKEN